MTRRHLKTRPRWQDMCCMLQVRLPSIFSPNQVRATIFRTITDWTSVASISSRKEIAGHPFSNVFSVSDGADVESASGIPYFYLSKLEMSVHDWQVMVGVIPLEFVQQNETIIYCHVSVAETTFL